MAKIFLDTTAVTSAVIRKDEQSRQETPAPIVEFLNDNLYTTSLNVARVFGKAHKDVLRKIERAKRNLSKSFNERNFAPVDYIDPKGERRPMYRLTRDGRLPAIIETGKDNGNGASQEAFYRLLWLTKKTGLLRNQKPKK